MKPIGGLLAGCCLALLILQPLGVQAQKTPEELQKETVAACAASARNKPTFALIKAEVDKACTLLEKEGTAALPKFKGKDSEFIFCGTYIWIHDLKGVMRMHPTRPDLEGKDQSDWKDSKGRRIFTEFTELAKSKGEGWIDHWWPKPGEQKPSRQVSYVKLCQVDGEEMVVGSGIFDLPDAEIKRLTKK